jgi:hypothetical protein
LTKFLLGLPDKVVARLAYAIERDRAAGGTGLPHDEILKALLPRLRRIYEIRVREKQSLQRVLETLPRDLCAALPVRPMGGFGAFDGPLDLSDPPSERNFRRAEGLAKVFSGLAGPASRFGLDRRFRLSKAEIASSVGTLQRGLIREIRAARAGDYAESYRRPAMALCSFVLGLRAMEDLRRAKPLN